jgi:hypothetical protein
MSYSLLLLTGSYFYTIFSSPQIHTWNSSHSGPVLQPNSGENTGKSLELHFFRAKKVLYMTCHSHSRFMAAILDFQRAQTLNTVRISLFVLIDLENMGSRWSLNDIPGTSLCICVRGSWQPCLIHLIHRRGNNYILTSLNFALNPGNIGVAVQISMIACKRAQKYVVAWVRPDNRGHLHFPDAPDIGEN